MTAAAATVGAQAVLVIGPGGPVPPPRPLALAMHWQRVTRAARRAAAAGQVAAVRPQGCPQGSEGQAGNGSGRGRSQPAGNSVGQAPGGYRPRPAGVRVTRKVRVGQAARRTVTVTRKVARFAAGSGPGPPAR